ncbi:hypothetical protein LOZ86_01095 [Pectobacterium parvum]|uniref:hypothetical protein n=1 Tax=Pectobacterium TaxID=122277 RepID=UPI0005046851|nr:MULTISPECIES: hypothetical protein [Pectobacterium]GKW41634.1 hypothetical protein PEC301879_14920 [Pectobacterium carotovorum subsp. carotovorum]KFX16680.1 hypothetical protein KP17_07285 [Pectobacterium parvum]KHS95519.1 hypothetical protein RC88_09545 [Pectobacterium parvum]MCU1800628.1 hypothetical protein [Pectobacterium parvum]UFK39548.1 hypothetical protein LOZ86_01095 [Pectobacterium parvum]
MSNIYIIDQGVQSGPFNQAETEKELEDYLERNRYANMKQAMNDVTSGKGKVTGDYTYNTYPVLHASSGNGQKSVSIFFYHAGTDKYLIAMGEHTTATSYLLSDFGQKSGYFKLGKTISI